MGVTVFQRSGLSERRVQPEWLDTLSPTDPRAQRSRRDLRRVNAIMGSLAALREVLDPLAGPDSKLHIIDLGAGDGHMMMQLAALDLPHWAGTRVTLVDMQPTISAADIDRFHRYGWTVNVVQADVLAWLRTAPRQPNDVIVANLFIHHFSQAFITQLLTDVAQRSSTFVCCEPLRSRLALLGSRCLGVLGCNSVTRHDAPISVLAGFRDRELTEMWPNVAGWATEERSVGLFVQRFQAHRVPVASE